MYNKALLIKNLVAINGVSVEHDDSHQIQITLQCDNTNVYIAFNTEKAKIEQLNIQHLTKNTISMFNKVLNVLYNYQTKQSNQYQKKAHLINNLLLELPNNTDETVRDHITEYFEDHNLSEKEAYTLVDLFSELIRTAYQKGYYNAQIDSEYDDCWDDDDD